MLPQSYTKCTVTKFGHF